MLALLQRPIWPTIKVGTTEVGTTEVGTTEGDVGWRWFHVPLMRGASRAVNLYR
jgi:hypothetical protein